MAFLLNIAVLLSLLALYCECMHNDDDDGESPGRKRKAAGGIVINEPSEEKAKGNAQKDIGRNLYEGKGKGKIGEETAGVADATEGFANMNVTDATELTIEKALEKDEFTYENAPKKLFTFICKDTKDKENGLKLEVSLEAMGLSGVFNHLLEDLQNNEKFFVPNVNEAMLRLIIKWCEWHIHEQQKAEAAEEEERQLDDLDDANEKTPLIAKAQIVEPLKATASNAAKSKPSKNKDNQGTSKNEDTREIAMRPRGVVSEWSKKFLWRFEVMPLCKIIEAANYLNIDTLVTDGCVVLDNKYIRNKTPDEIRAAFNIDLRKSPEFSEENLAYVKRENAWFTGDIIDDGASSSAVAAH